MGLSREESYRREDHQRACDEAERRHYVLPIITPEDICDSRERIYEPRALDTQELDAYCASQMSPEELYNSCCKHLGLMEDIAPGIQNSHHRSVAKGQLEQALSITLPDPAGSQPFEIEHLDELRKYAPAFWRMARRFQAWSDEEDSGEV